VLTVLVSERFIRKYRSRNTIEVPEISDTHAKELESTLKKPVIRLLASKLRHFLMRLMNAFTFIFAFFCEGSNPKSFSTVLTCVCMYR